MSKHDLSPEEKQILEEMERELQAAERDLPTEDPSRYFEDKNLVERLTAPLHGFILDVEGNVFDLRTGEPMEPDTKPEGEPRDPGASSNAG